MKGIETNSDCYMYWQINRICNFECSYCFREWSDESSRTEDPACGKYSAEHIALRFDETGKVWHIYMTGGEPLLYPGFVELAKALTRMHYISVSTNLSTPNAYEFAEAVESERVHSVYANVHISEREKRRDGMKEYLQKFLHFQQRGFNIWLVYITHPPLLGRVEEDIQRFRSEGIRQIKLKVFQGKYKGRRYPRDYSDDERAFVKRLGLDNYEHRILTGRVSFLGSRCQAGHSAFTMDIAGNVRRCNTLKNWYGNLFEGTFKPGKSSLRCPKKKCSCAYQGMYFATAGGNAVPPNVVVRPVQFFISVGELLAGLNSKTPR